MIKVLYLTNYTKMYGANASLVDMILNLTNINILPIVVTCGAEGDFTEILKKHGIKYYIVPFHINFIAKSDKDNAIRLFSKTLRVLRNNIYDYFVVTKQLKKIIDENDIQLIHTNSFCMSIGAQTSKRYNIPHVWHIREFMEEDYGLTIIKTPFFKDMVKSTDRFIVISEAVRKKHESVILSAPNTVLHDGISIKGESIRTEAKPEKKIFAILGLVQPAKGFHDAVRAACELYCDGNHSFELWIVGGTNEPVYYESLRDIVSRFRAEECIRFFGYCENVKEIMADVFCGLMCSRLEGLGRTTVEFMMSKKPVIGADTGGTKEIITDGVNGFLYHYGDCEDLKSKMLDMLNLSSDEYIKMGKAAYSYATEEFSPPKYSKKILKIYEEILSEN